MESEAQEWRSTGVAPNSNDPAGAPFLTGGAPTAGVGAAAEVPPARRTVCDHCRRRRIRCDGLFPCAQCINAALTCKRDHVPRKRGPKRGNGRVINKLRAEDEQGHQRTSRDSSAEAADYVIGDRSTDGGDTSAPQTAPSSVPSTPPDTLRSRAPPGSRPGHEPRGIYTSDHFRPTTRNYLHLIPQCIDLYYEHIYPIMPLLYMPTIRTMNYHAMTHPEKNLIYALCALTCLHMAGKSVQQEVRSIGPESLEAAGRFFIDECISVRQSYDFFEDQSLYAVISSFWLSTSFFELNQSRKSWVYLREALTLALDMGLDDDSTYVGLGPAEKLCRQRVFWQLFVTERSFAILRSKPITFKRTPSLPTAGHSYESSEIHAGFRQLISSYVPLNESFVAAWNDSSDPVSTITYLHLQDILSRPPAFLTRSRATTPSSDGTPRSLPDMLTPSATTVPTTLFPPAPPPTPTKPDPDATSFPFAEEPSPDPTSIQKADLLITQQWLRLIVWRSSQQRNLLTFHAAQPSMDVAFPLAIARSTASILASLPEPAVEVHGMGIFEKIFKIGVSYVDAMGMCDAAAVQPSGVDFAGGGDLGVLGLGRRGFSVDPLEFFVKTLSATPNSRRQFAEELIVHAAKRPWAVKMALSPGLGMGAAPLTEMRGGWGCAGAQSMVGSVGQPMGGSVLGEVADDGELEPGVTGERVKRTRTEAMPLMTTQTAVGYTPDFDIGLLSPGVADAGFGHGIPGLTSGLVWPVVGNQHNWATAETPSAVEPLDGFSFGQALGTDTFTYETFGVGDPGALLGGNGTLMGGNNGYPRFQPVPGLAPEETDGTIPGGTDGQHYYMSALQDDGQQRRKRNWEGNQETW